MLKLLILIFDPSKIIKSEIHILIAQYVEILELCSKNNFLQFLFFILMKLYIYDLYLFYLGEFYILHRKTDVFCYYSGIL